MGEWIECVGGPLDGEWAERYGMGAFAWPSGWYYTGYRQKPGTDHDSEWIIVYRWDGDAGTYIDSDHEKWLAGERPQIAPSAPTVIDEMIRDAILRGDEDWLRGDA